MFGADREPLTRRLPGECAHAVPLEDSDPHRSLLAAIDGSALGFSRAKHHQYLTGDATMKGFLLYTGNDCVGYVYVNTYGHIGPFAVSRKDAVAAAFVAALKLAAAGAPQVSAFIPGANEAALTVAAAVGMRITFPMLLMSSHEFGDWGRYLPRNPGFM